MSEFDVMPYKSASGGHSQMGSNTIHASEVFHRGDPVAIDADGFIEEALDEPIAGGTGEPNSTAATGNIVGICAANTASLIAFSSDGTQATANSEGIQVPYYELHRGDQFVLPAARFTEADDTTFDGTVASTNVGDLCSLRTGTTDWGVCIHTSSSNRDFRIVKVLDADGKDAVASGATITDIVIRVEV